MFIEMEDPKFMLVLSILQMLLIELDMTNCSRFYKIEEFIHLIDNRYV